MKNKFKLPAKFTKKTVVYTPTEFAADSIFTEWADGFFKETNAKKGDVYTLTIGDEEIKIKF
jgi:hypothetical protein